MHFWQRREVYLGDAARAKAVAAALEAAGYECELRMEKARRSAFGIALRESGEAGQGYVYVRASEFADAQEAAAFALRKYEEDALRRNGRE